MTDCVLAWAACGAGFITYDDILSHSIFETYVGHRDGVAP
jgi:hypothetical protein